MVYQKIEAFRNWHTYFCKVWETDGWFMEDRAVVILRVHDGDIETDIDIPLDITAQEFLTGINTAYDLGIDVANAKSCHVHTENPIALIRGSKTLLESGVRNGTVINIV
jgi:hypothetical protein